MSRLKLDQVKASLLLSCHPYNRSPVHAVVPQIIVTSSANCIGSLTRNQLAHFVQRGAASHDDPPKQLLSSALHDMLEYCETVLATKSSQRCDAVWFKPIPL